MKRACESKIPLPLHRFEYRFYSQNQEDGIIEEILYHIGQDSKYYVEFGAGDGFRESNTARLREDFGWQGLLMDMCFTNPDINLQQEYITAENINELFEKYKVPKNLDFLSIDVDYNDFYIWRALDSTFRPRLVMIEYNAAHEPSLDRVEWNITAIITGITPTTMERAYSLNIT